jgi:hypothetical protein
MSAIPENPSACAEILSFVTQDIDGVPHMLTTGGKPVPEEESACAPRLLAEFIFLTRSHGMHTPAMIVSRQIRRSFIETTC